MYDITGVSFRHLPETCSMSCTLEMKPQSGTPSVDSTRYVRMCIHVCMYVGTYVSIHVYVHVCVYH